MADFVGAIVARNGGPPLAAAVGDLARAFGAQNVLVVDNASTDQSTDHLPVPVSRQDTNLGFAAGANIALAWAEQTGATGLLLLNQDARVDSADIERMIRLFSAEPEIAVVFAKVVRPDKPYLLDGLYGRRNLRHKLTTGLGAGRPAAPRELARPRWVQHGHGAAMLLRVSAAQGVGGFDQSLFAYHDEVDLCWRLAKAQWRVALEPRATVFHRGPADEPARRQAKSYLLARNSLRVARKNAGWPGFLSVALWALAATLVYYGPTALAGDAVSQAFLAGWADGLRGRPPRPSVLATL